MVGAYPLVLPGWPAHNSRSSSALTVASFAAAHVVAPVRTTRWLTARPKSITCVG